MENGGWVRFDPAERYGEILYRWVQTLNQHHRLGAHVEQSEDAELRSSASPVRYHTTLSFAGVAGVGNRTERALRVCEAETLDVLDVDSRWLPIPGESSGLQVEVVQVHVVNEVRRFRRPRGEKRKKLAQTMVRSLLTSMEFEMEEYGTGHEFSFFVGDDPWKHPDVQDEINRMLGILEQFMWVCSGYLVEKVDGGHRVTVDVLHT